MASYLAYRIELGKLNYNSVIKKYSQFKDDIDVILTNDGYSISDDNGSVISKN